MENPKLLLASGEFDLRRVSGQRQPGIGIVAAKYGLTAKQLTNYRANNSRKQERKYEKHTH